MGNSITIRQSLVVIERERERSVVIEKEISSLQEETETAPTNVRTSVRKAYCMFKTWRESSEEWRQAAKAERATYLRVTTFGATWSGNNEGELSQHVTRICKHEESQQQSVGRPMSPTKESDLQVLGDDETTMTSNGS